MIATETERLRRWRLILGGDQADGTGVSLSATDATIDRCLTALYEEKPEGSSRERSGGLGGSAPSVARWLGDIRTFFPSSVVRVMQQDAMERLNLKQLLLEPEMLETVEADVHLVADLLALSGVMPSKTKETARLVVRKCVEELDASSRNPCARRSIGRLNRAIRNRRPRHNEIDWNRTIRANLKHYQAKYKTIVPETRIGFGRKRNALRDIILCVDQSGSMATSVVYSGIFGAVLASLPAVRTQVVVFDTNVVDLSDKLDDPVEVLFGTQLGGGTDINRAITYCQSLVRQPDQTIMVLISDLIEGGVRENLIKRAGSIISSGVSLVTLLALSDDGAPMYDHENAAALAELGSPAFACTPDKFPDLMAAAIGRQNLAVWAAANGIATTRAEPA